MRTKLSVPDLLVPFRIMLFALIVTGCGSPTHLTKEEIKLKKLYAREVAEDKEYIIAGSAFSVRPVLEPNTDNFMRRVGGDGIEFFTDAHLLDRDPRFFVGRLATYFQRTNMYETPDTGLASLRLLYEHSKPHHAIRVLADTNFTVRGFPTHQFVWEVTRRDAIPKEPAGQNRQADPNALIIGAVIVTDNAAILAYLSENELPTFQWRDLTCASTERWSVSEANARMEGRFREFFNNIRFDESALSVR